MNNKSLILIVCTLVLFTYGLLRIRFASNNNEDESLVSSQNLQNIVPQILVPNQKLKDSDVFITLTPTIFPTLNPSESQASSPTLFPTPLPIQVTKNPSSIPTKDPTKLPTISVTEFPTSKSPSPLENFLTTKAPSQINYSKMNMLEGFSKFKDEQLEEYVKTLEYPKLKVWEDHIPNTCLMKPKIMTYHTNINNDISSPINKIIEIPLLNGTDRLEYIHVKMKNELEGEIRLLRKSNFIYLFARFVGTHVFGLNFYRESFDSNVLIADVSFPSLGGSYSLSIITALSSPISKIGGIRHYEERQEVSQSFRMTIKPQNQKPKSNQVYYSMSTKLLHRLRNDSLMSTIGLIPQQEMNYSFSDGSKYNRTCLHELLLKSLNGSKICFVGDSHLRYLACELRYAFENIEYQGMWVFEGYSRFFAFEWARYGFDLKGSLAKIRSQNNCSIIIAGVGQWALSNSRSKPMYPVNLYISEIEQFLIWWKNLTDEIKLPLTFLPIEPCSGTYVYVTDPLSISVVDWRHASLIQTWNNPLRILLNSYNIKIFDSYSYLVPFHELTVDYCHFTRPQLDAVIDSLLVSIFS